MSNDLSLGNVKHLLLRNQSPFDATLQLVDLSVSGSSFPLGPDLRAGDSVVFQLVTVPGLTNGIVFTVQLVTKGAHITQSTAKLTYTGAAPPVRKAKFVVGGSRDDPRLDYAGLTDVEIPNEILGDVDFKTRYRRVDYKPIPDPDPLLTEKFRWIQCVVKNQTQFPIQVQGPPYLDSGRYWTPPTDVERFDQMVFSCCNGDYSMAGATGGTAFRITLDPVTFYDFAVGWTTPAVGGFKASIVKSDNPKDAYEQATLEGNALTSKEVFRGFQKSGNPVERHIYMSAAAGQYMIYVITEV